MAILDPSSKQISLRADADGRLLVAAEVTTVPVVAAAPTAAPTGVPAGRVAMRVDSLNNRVYFYVNGAWKYAALT